jgi:hypothetical protein
MDRPTTRQFFAEVEMIRIDRRAVRGTEILAILATVFAPVDLPIASDPEVVLLAVPVDVLGARVVDG